VWQPELKWKFAWYNMCNMFEYIYTYHIHIFMYMYTTYTFTTYVYIYVYIYIYVHVFIYVSYIRGIVVFQVGNDQSPRRCGDQSSIARCTTH